jgi:hypothetical protein
VHEGADFGMRWRGADWVLRDGKGGLRTPRTAGEGGVEGNDDDARALKRVVDG